MEQDTRKDVINLLKQCEDTTDMNPVAPSGVEKRRKMYYGIKIDDAEANSRTEQWLLVDKRTITKLRSKVNPTVSNYSLMLVEDTIFSKYTHRDTQNYVWLIVMMGVFYSLPVIQLVFTQQENVLNTG